MAQFVFIQWLDDVIALGLLNFDWDLGNNSKSIEKHGISNQQAEETYCDENKSYLEFKYHPNFLKQGMGY